MRSPRTSVLKGRQNGQKINIVYKNSLFPALNNFYSIAKKHKFNKYLGLFSCSQFLLSEAIMIFAPGRQKYQLRHRSQTARMYSSLSASNQVSNPYKRTSPAGIFMGGQRILNPVIGSTFQMSLNVSPIVLICDCVFCCLFLTGSSAICIVVRVSSFIAVTLQESEAHKEPPAGVPSVGNCFRSSHQLKQA